MRLLEAERQAIRICVLRKDKNARVFLFGSRTNDDARGGDIDILVVSEKLGLLEKIGILGDLEKILGETDIDIVVRRSLEEDAFVRLIAERGLLAL